MALPMFIAPIKVIPSALTTMVILADGSVRAFGVCHSWCLSSTETFSATGLSIAIAGEPIVDISTHNSLNPGTYSNSNHTIVCSATGKVYTFGASVAGYGLLTTTPVITSPYLVPLPAGSYCKRVFALMFTSYVLLRAFHETPRAAFSDLELT